MCSFKIFLSRIKNVFCSEWHFCYYFCLFIKWYIDGGKYAKIKSQSMKKFRQDLKNGVVSFELKNYPNLIKNDIKEELGDTINIRFYDSTLGQKAIYKD